VSLLACGSFHTVIVCTNTAVLAFGENGDGQLGLGSRISARTPVAIPFFQGKMSRLLACGEQHTLIACDDGLFAFGSGEHGQLGVGDAGDRIVPERVAAFDTNGSELQRLACGTQHSVVVFAGRVYSFGWNCNGQLGVGDEADRYEPTLVPALDGREIIDVQCGVHHTVVLTDDGIYAMGGNSYGQLGLGHFVNCSSPQRVPFFQPDIRGVSAWFHTVVWTGSAVYTFGEGTNFKLGTDAEADEPPNRPDPTPVHVFSGREVLECVAGSEHTYVHTSEGLYAWGTGEGGKLGHGDQEEVRYPASSYVEAFRGHRLHVIGAGVDHLVVYTEPGPH